MQELLSRLVRLLEEKEDTLKRLIDMQEQMRSYLMRPYSKDFDEVAKPQKILLATLRNSQDIQKKLLGQIASNLGISSIPSLLILTKLIDNPWRDRIAKLADVIKHATKKLKKATEIHSQLNDANGRFLQRWAGLIRPSNKYVGTYNAQGLPQKWAFGTQLSQTV